MDRPPPAAEPDLGGQVRRGVERGREDARFRRADEVDVARVLRDRAQPGQALQDLAQVLGGSRAHAQPGDGGVGLARSDAHVEDLERAVEVHDLIQDLRQDERIDDVSAEPHDFLCHRSASITRADGSCPGLARMSDS
jgi:hypothetical protein